MKLLQKLFRRRSRHKPRRDEDLQGRPAQPEVEAARANVEAVMAHRYADRTKNRPTRKRPRLPTKHLSKHYRRPHVKGDFGNPRWMRAEGVTPFGISSRPPQGRVGE